MSMSSLPISEGILPGLNSPCRNNAVTLLGGPLTSMPSQSSIGNSTDQLRERSATKMSLAASNASQSAINPRFPKGSAITVPFAQTLGTGVADGIGVGEGTGVDVGT